MSTVISAQVNTSACGPCPYPLQALAGMGQHYSEEGHWETALGEEKNKTTTWRGKKLCKGKQGRRLRGCSLPYPFSAWRSCSTFSYVWPGPLRLLAPKAQEADGSSVCCGVWPCPSSSLALQSSSEYSWLTSKQPCFAQLGHKAVGLGFILFSSAPLAGSRPVPLHRPCLLSRPHTAQHALSTRIYCC